MKNINTNDLTLFELDALIHHLQQIRSRRLMQESLTIDLENLLQRAQDKGFSLVCTTTGQTLNPNYITVFDKEYCRDD